MTFDVGQYDNGIMRIHNQSDCVLNLNLECIQIQCMYKMGKTNGTYNVHNVIV
jgi:hypothetical protein